MLFLLSLFACKNDILLSSVELGNINYTIVTGYKIDGLSLNEAKLAVGYPQTIEASLTLRGWKVVGDQPFLVYHSSADESMSVDSESLLDGDIGVPGFSVQADTAGSFMVESYLQDKLVDQISLNFVVPDAVSVLSWIREPGAEEFTAAEGDTINVTVGSQAAFIPIPEFEGERIVGTVEADISIEPPEAAVLGYNIDEVSESGVEASSNPASIYFVQAGEVKVCATDTVNAVTTCQDFSVSE
jgi:hypothetical protein